MNTDTTTTPDNAPWTTTFKIEGEDLGYLQNRGLDKKTAGEAMLEVIKAHRAAEKHIGVPVDQLVKLPKDINDKAGRDALWTKLGRPATVEAMLEAIKPLGVDETFAKSFAAKAFELGMPKDMAEGAVKAYKDWSDTARKGEDEARAAKNEAERLELKKSWGGNATVNLMIAQKAAETFGIDKETLAAIEERVGPKKIMDTFLALGMKVGEDTFIDSGQGGPTKTAIRTPEQAKERITALKQDQTWVTAYLAGDVTKREEMENLTKIAIGFAG